MQDKTTIGKIFRHEFQAQLDAFLALSTGYLNRSNFVREMYYIQDVTSYIHVLVNYVAEFLEIHYEFKLTAFSYSAIEKKTTCMCVFIFKIH